MADPAREWTLLCEGCGYVIEGLDRAGKCPECGRAIELSLPSRRRGTPWQRQELGWWRSGIALLRSPRRVFAEMRIDAARSLDLQWANTVATAVAGGLTPLMFALGALVAGSARSDETMVSAAYFACFAFILLFFLLAAAVSCLIAIESLGVRVIGRTRGWRISPRVADWVCAHAAIGWVVGGIAACVAALLCGATVTGAPTLVPAVMLGLWVLGGPLIGMLCFEVLVYIGIRECKFANIGAEPVTPAPTESGEPTAAAM